MSGNLFNIGRYFKKSDMDKSVSATANPVAADSVASGQNTPPIQQNVTIPTQQTVPVNQPQATSQPYNGIGTPPSVEKGDTPPTATTEDNYGKRFPVESAESDKPAAETKANVPNAADDQKAKTTDVPPKPSATGAIDMNKRTNMDILTRLTQRSAQVLMAAVSKAKSVGVKFVDTEHVLWGLLADAQVYQLISELKIIPKEIQDDLEKNFKKDTFTGQPQFSPRVKHVLEMALSASRAMKYEYISPEHILLAVSQEGEGMAAQILVKHGLTTADINKKVTGKKQLLEKDKQKGGGSVLGDYCEDLTQKAKEGRLDPVVGRASEIERTIHILSRRTKNNPVLIGDAGVGKTAIVEGLAQRIASGDVPETLKDKHILQVDLMSLIAGAKHRGEFEERLKNLIHEVKGSAGMYILFIDEIHNMVGAGSGGEGSMDASNILKPSLARGELQTIGTTTTTEYRQHIEKDPALERRFQPIVVAEPSDDQAVEMLHALRDKYEAFHKVSIPDEVIEAAVRLSKRYVGDRFLPDKAVDLIDEASASVRLPAISLPEEMKSLQKKIDRLQNEHKEAKKINDKVRLSMIEKELIETNDELTEKKQAFEKKQATTTNVVSVDVVQEIVSRWTNIPISKLTEKETDKLVKLEDLIHKRFIDQERAVSAISEAVRRGRAGLKSNKRPIGSFIFMGPTGVGKTELAKALADILFGSEELMVRLDMTEYMERHEVAKLIGAPPGYVGYEEGGQLTEAVRRHPYSVVLFDEIEKAHPDVFNILIQLLDDGRLTDNKGHTISFKNTIVICTSNIGTEHIQKHMLKDGEAKDDKEMASVPDVKTLFKEAEIDSAVSAAVLSDLVGRYITNTPKILNTFNKKELVADLVKETSGDAQQIDTAVANMTAGQKVIDIKALSRESGQTEEYLQTTLKAISAHIVNSHPEIVNSAMELLKDTKVVGEISKNYSIPMEKLEKLQSGQKKVPQPAANKLSVDQIAANTKLPKEKVLDVIAMLFETAVFLKPDLTQGISQDKDCIKATSDLTKITEAQLVTFYDEIAKITTELNMAALTQKLHLEAQVIHTILKMTSQVLLEKRTQLLKEALQSVAIDTVYEEVAKNLQLKSQNIQEVVGAILSYKETEQEEKVSLGTTQDGVKDATYAELSELLLGELRKFFRPELLNRFDELVVFRPLSREHMEKIVDLQILILAKLLEDQSVALVVTTEARKQLAKIGYDPIFGARPLRRTIQRYIENPISNLVIKGDTHLGDTIQVGFDGAEFTFVVEHPQATPTVDSSENISTTVDSSVKQSQGTASIGVNKTEENKQEVTPGKDQKNTQPPADNGQTKDIARDEKVGTANGIVSSETLPDRSGEQKAPPETQKPASEAGAANPQVTAEAAATEQPPQANGFSKQTTASPLEGYFNS